MTSSARFFAVVISHAAGFSGKPRTFQTSSARQNASCTTSSTSVRLCTPKIRVSAATMRADSRRNRCSVKAIGIPQELQDHHRTDLHRPADVEHRATAGQHRRLLEIACPHDDEAGDHVLDLDEWTVGDRLLRAAHDLSGAIEGLAPILEVSPGLEIAHP